MNDERRAKDVVRDRDVAERKPLWAETTNRLMARYWRRPAGSSARLWKKVGADDPFLPPKAERKMVEEHRQVSAAARFVRIDKAENKGKGGLPGPKKQGRQENVPEWVKKLREQAQNRAAAGKAPPKIRKTPSQVHTPSALSKAPTVRPGSKKHKNAPPPPAPPRPEPRRVSKSGRLLPQRPSRPGSASGAPGRPPLIRDHQPDTAPGKAFAELDAQETDRRPPLIRPDAGSSRRGGPIRRGVAPPGGAPPLIRPGEGRPRAQQGGRRRPTGGERPKGPPGGAPPLVRDFQPETGPRDPFKERFGASSAPKRTAKRIQRGAAPPGGAPPLIRDGKPVDSPKPMMETPPTRAEASPSKRPAPSGGGDPFSDFLSGGGDEGRTRLKRSKPNEDAPKRRRPVVGGPPPGGAPPLNKDAEAVSSSTMASAPSASNTKPAPARPVAAKPASRPASDDPFADFGGGPSEGRTRLKRSKPAGDAPQRKRPVIGGPPPGGTVPLNKDADAVSSPTSATSTPPTPKTKPAPKPSSAGRPARPPSDDPFADFLSGGGPSEGRTRLKRSKPSDEPPKRKRPVIGGPPPGGTVPLNKDADAVSSPTSAKKKKKE